MLLGILPIDSINVIFTFLHQILDIRSLQCTCNYFNENEIKKKINDIINKKKIYIKTLLPDLLIRILGGYNDVLHFETINELHSISDVDQLTIHSLYTRKYINRFKNVLILGTFSNDKGFISFSIKKDNILIEYVIYQEYNHKLSNWSIKDFHRLPNSSKVCSNTFKLIEFKKGYLDYTDSTIRPYNNNFEMYKIIIDHTLDIDKKKIILGRY